MRYSSALRCLIAWLLLTACAVGFGWQNVSPTPAPSLQSSLTRPLSGQCYSEELRARRITTPCGTTPSPREPSYSGSRMVWARRLGNSAFRSRGNRWHCCLEPAQQFRQSSRSGELLLLSQRRQCQAFAQVDTTRVSIRPMCPLRVTSCLALAACPLGWTRCRERPDAMCR